MLLHVIAAHLLSPDWSFLLVIVILPRSCSPSGSHRLHNRVHHKEWTAMEQIAIALHGLEIIHRLTGCTPLTGDTHHGCRGFSSPSLATCNS